MYYVVFVYLVVELGYMATPATGGPRLMSQAACEDEP